MKKIIKIKIQTVVTEGSMTKTLNWMNMCPVSFSEACVDKTTIKTWVKDNTKMKTRWLQQQDPKKQVSRCFETMIQVSRTMSLEFQQSCGLSDFVCNNM